jgi:hypothetical protein
MSAEENTKLANAVQTQDGRAAIAAIEAKVVAAKASILAMEAANQRRAMQGCSPAYDDDSFSPAATDLEDLVAKIAKNL